MEDTLELVAWLLFQAQIAPMLKIWVILSARTVGHIIILSSNWLMRGMNAHECTALI